MTLNPFTLISDLTDEEIEEINFWMGILSFVGFGIGAIATIWKIMLFTEKNKEKIQQIGE